MKKLFVIVMAVLFMAVVVGPTFAQGTKSKTASAATDIIRGTVVSVDPVKKEIVVKIQKTGEDKSFIISEKAIAALKAGVEVKITVKAGTDTVEKVKIIKSEANKK